MTVLMENTSMGFVHIWCAGILPRSAFHSSSKRYPQGKGILGVGRVLMGTDISVFDGFDLEGDPDKSDYRNELIAHCGLNMDIIW